MAITGRVLNLIVTFMLPETDLGCEGPLRLRNDDATLNISLAISKEIEYKERVKSGRNQL